MDAEIKAKWVAALRSGEYQQGQGMLRLDGEFCCLGVLCDVSGIGKWTSTYCYMYGAGDIEETCLPMSLRDRLGVGPDQEVHLMNMNDGGENFAGIADYIEEHL